MRIFNASSINFHIYDGIIDYSHHAIYYMSKIYLVKFLFHKIWVLLVNYSHKMVVIDLPYLSHHTKSRDVCQSNLLHVGHNFGLLIKPPFSASQLRVTETDSSFSDVEIRGLRMVHMGWSNHRDEECAKCKQGPMLMLCWYTVSIAIVSDIFLWCTCVSLSPQLNVWHNVWLIPKLHAAYTNTREGIMELSHGEPLWMKKFIPVSIITWFY